MIDRRWRAPLHVAIVGYGIAGIAAALQLRRLGHHITHFDRHAPPAALGAGMLLHPPALRQLNQLGLLDEALARGAPVRRICAQTVSGRPLMDFGYADVGARSVGLGIQRGTLHHLLSSADSGHGQVLAGCKITSLDPGLGFLSDEAGVRHGPYDLIVAADGTNSLLRTQLPIAARHDQASDSAALVGLIDDSQGIASDRLTQYFDAARHLSVWPAGRGPSGGTPKCSIAMNVSLAEAATFRDRGEWRNTAQRLCPAVGKLLDEHGEGSSFHIFSYRDVELSRLAAGRVVAIGDAAHSMSPQLGIGAQLAMEDAAMLATELDRHADLPRALRAYEAARLPQLRQYHRVSRWLTPLFQSDNQMLAMLREQFLPGMMRWGPAKQLMHALLC